MFIMKCNSKGGGCAKGASVKRCVEDCKCTKPGSRIVNQIPKDKLCIVHFPHSFGEYPIRTIRQSSATAVKIENNSYDVYWNCLNKHFRKLVRVSSGAYIDRDRIYREITNEELCVWTEWESITCANDMLPSSDPLDAKFIHQPKYPVSVAVAAKNPDKFYGKRDPNDALNTDPCIFGRTFKYALCRQKHDPWLRQLTENSLIVFWSHKGDSFCLDTVFVVGKDPVDYRIGSKPKINCSQEYRNLTIDRLGAGFEATFYRGGPYDNRNPPPIYSFAPARILSDTTAYGCRCEFDAKDLAQLNAVIGCQEEFIKIGGHRRSKAVCVNSDRVKRVWNKLADLVIGKGFVLGVRFDWPK